MLDAMRRQLQRGSVVGHEPQMRRKPIRQAAIDSEVVLRHAPGGEALFESLPDLLPRKMAQAIDRADGAVDIFNNKAGEAIFDNFRNRAAVECYDRGPASH